ncbi:P-loop containing nucleoside triphosphate hydrolase protein [Mycena leptocephala]|nr:P-loop containing nucleoside triphosphate hydrolase protein [Mycena leptocephala]
MSLGMTHQNIQNVKRNRDDCIRLLENIHQILYTIVNLHIKSETAGSLHPTMLGHIGKFTETLQKIHTFVEAQQDGSKIKYFLRHSEMNTLLKDCHSGLDEVLEVFKIKIGTISFTGIVDMKQKTENMHNELLELISTLSDGTSDDRSSSLKLFSMLPSKPKILNGRESELKHIVEALTHNSSRVAIIGGGGMGKTSLARAALHHPDIAKKFTQRYFVSAESATNSVEVAALIDLHLGLNPGKDLTNPVVQYFFRQPPCLLILDNLETPWEPIVSRGAVEELLFLLTDVPHLAMMITMRGAERPSRVAWTHPFLPPLQPLSDDAALKTFIDITDGSLDNEDMKRLLLFTDNMPLAVELIAHLVDYEGNKNVLTRWGIEKTSLLSAGHDRRSNLDASISLSLSSPWITAGAKDLLSLLSILPDGLSDIELLQSNLPIQDIRTCKAVKVQLLPKDTLR